MYTAYGLNISSDISLPELPASRSGEDVAIRIEKLDESFLDAELKNADAFSRVGCTVKICSDKTFYRWKGIGKALIRRGREVLIEPENNLEAAELAPFITGAILGNLLNQRGFFVLHGSGVVVNDRGIAFLGDKGAGKSTLAVHLQTRGHRFITDDLIPVIFDDDDEIRTAPGFPRIRLWSDSVESVGLNPAALPPINSFLDKHSYRCFESFSDQPVAISRLFILENSEKTGIERLKAPDAFIEIVRNTYMNRYLRATGQSAEHFRQCESLVKKVPVFKLKRPYDFERLPQVAELIESFE